ncbi:Tfp pilus assembly protein, ATPase PilM [Paenibacillus sp. yr247]|uniref:type IV pilus biogenesis protein PilM n=1 Tax=Paenibacillus sp. yr247 TaxID=1761880 RepID=UPI00088BDF8A|nr:pilus assembly protein PilM [Paenibacillus sp. yr247]SDN82900.1 Tfp pilus assembly protein, ATPase PilM [Paenibacillus sp. yr247]
MRTSRGSIIKALKPGQTSLGIEISDSSIKMSKVLLRDKKEPLIQTNITEELPPHVMEEGRIKEPLRLIQTLQTMIARLDSKPKHVHLVFPSQLVMVRFLKLPDIAEKDLAKLVDFEMKHNIHLPFENPLYDFVKMNGATHKKRKTLKKLKKVPVAPTGKDSFLEAAAGKEDLGGGKGLFDDFQEDEPKAETAIQCDVMLVAAPKDMMDQYLEVMDSAGIKLTSIEIKALSLFRLLQRISLIEWKDTFLLVDLNENAGDLSIFNGEELKITRSIPLNFAVKPDITSEVKVSTDQLFAEFLKTDGDFRNHCNDLAHELERLMNFYRYTLNNRNQEFAGVVISGDLERMPEIVLFLTERLPIPVHLFQPTIPFEQNSASSDVFSMYAVTLGLALRGAES